MLTSAAEIDAVSRLVVEKVVGRELPFHCTVAPEAKFEPFTVSVKAGLPAVALVGEIELIVGAGGGGDGAALPPPHPVAESHRHSCEFHGNLSDFDLTSHSRLASLRFCRPPLRRPTCRTAGCQNRRN